MSIISQTRNWAPIRHTPVEQNQFELTPIVMRVRKRLMYSNAQITQCKRARIARTV